jgi:integrase
MAGTWFGGPDSVTILLRTSDIRRVIAYLDLSTDIAVQTRNRLGLVISRFATYLERANATISPWEVSPAVVREFVHAPLPDGTTPSASTLHFRRSALRLLFRSGRRLGITEGDPTLDLSLPPRSTLRVRPLTDDEVAMGRSFSVRSLTETRRPAAWALAEATARISEVALVRASHVDLDKCQVWLPGGARVVGRWGHLTEWGVEHLDRRMRAVHRSDHDPALCYGAAGSAESRRASCSAAIQETLRRAGLADEPDVRPSSVVAWAGRQAFEESGRIEVAAKCLGLRSLDAAARLIGWDWSGDELSDEAGETRG